jgi:hypothetical protein
VPVLRASSEMRGVCSPGLHRPPSRKFSSPVEPFLAGEGFADLEAARTSARAWYRDVADSRRAIAPQLHEPAMVPVCLAVLNSTVKHSRSAIL